MSSDDPSTDDGFIALLKEAPPRQIVILLLVLAPMVGLPAFLIFGSPSAQAELAILLGFEPWKVSRVADLRLDEERLFLVEERLTPQRGTWTRYSLLDPQLNLRSQEAFLDDIQVRGLTPNWAWVRADWILLRLDLPSLTLGEALEDHARTKAAGDFVSASLTPEGFIRVEMSDGRLVVLKDDVPPASSYVGPVDGFAKSGAFTQAGVRWHIESEG